MKNLALLFILILLISCDEVSKPENKIQSDSCCGSIKGKVTDGSTGLPIFGASISTEPTTGNYLTDLVGKYNISDLDSGLYVVNVSKVGYKSKTLSAIVKVGKSTNIDFDLIKDSIVNNRPKGSISGIVAEVLTGNPLSFVKIETVPSTVEEFTNIEGRFSITNIDTGLYQVIASKSGYNTKETIVNVKKDDTAKVSIWLPPVNADLTAYIEVNISCKNHWPVTITIDKLPYMESASKLLTYKTKEGNKTVTIEENNTLFYSCDKQYGKTWTFQFFLKRGETRQLSVECCD